MNLEDIDKLIDETNIVIRNASDELAKWSKVKKDAEKAVMALEETRVVFGGEPRRKANSGKKRRRAGSYPKEGTQPRIILDYIKDRFEMNLTATEVAVGVGMAPKLVGVLMADLVRDGLLTRVERGVYRHKEQTPEAAEGDFALTQ